MYYAITDQKVHSAKNLNALNRKMNAYLEEKEFKTLGPDKVIYLTEKDISFIEDKRRLSQIPVSKLYQKDNIKVFLYIILAIQTITFLRIPSVSSIVSQISALLN